jgi:hypothetical protein
MILFSSKKSAVHDMHLDAIASYAAENGLKVSGRLYKIGAVQGLLRNRDRYVFSQSTGLSSLIVLPLARILGKKVVHYLHEPTSLGHKLKDNPVIKSIVWQMVQWIEMRCASTVMVSRQPLLDQAAKVYGISVEKIVLAPLLMPKESDLSGGTRTRITYLGRIDERRFFREFLQNAPALHQRGFLPTLLTGDVENVRKYRASLPAELEVFAEQNFSEALKSQILGDTLVLWNPKRGEEIAQSGVTADAVRNGVAVLLTDKDPTYAELLKYGIAIDFDKAMAGDLACLDTIAAGDITRAAAQLFDRSHGALAFEASYLGELR